MYSKQCISDLWWKNIYSKTLFNRFDWKITFVTQFQKYFTTYHEMLKNTIYDHKFKNGGHITMFLCWLYL